VDAHPKDGESDEQLLQKQQKAEQEKNALCKFFEDVNVPYLLEASGTPFSYHVWVFVKPVEAVKAREFGRDVLKHLGIKKMEVFPKQTKITKNGYGNLVKLPLATHRKNGMQSKLFLNGAWVRDFDEIDIGIVDISEYEPEVKIKVPKKVIKSEGIRPIFHWALNQDLTGSSDAHFMRVAIVREFFNHGVTDTHELAALFQSQSDFRWDKSIEQIESIIKDEYGVWSWDTLNDRCGIYVERFLEENHRDD
jgi:hypothetical protein